MADCDLPETFGNLFRPPAQAKRPPIAGYLLMLGALVPLAVTAVFMIRDITDPARLAIALALIAAFAGLFVFFTLRAGERAMFYTLIAETVIVAGLNIVPGPHDGFLFIVFAVLSAQLGMTLRPRVVALWFLVLVAITLVTNLAAFGVEGWLPTFGNVTGYSFFVVVGALMREALLGRERSDRLAQELRSANEQLQGLSLQSQQLAVLEERNRMARELHDSLGHRLTVAVVQLEGAQRLIPSDPERAARMVGAMREQMKEALADLRRAVAALRAPLDDDAPLGPALARLAQSFQEGTGVQVSLALPETFPDLPPMHRLALFRVAQELLTNAQRHAAARHVWLDVSAGSERVVLTVTDDGKGFNEESVAGGFGLRGIRERAAQLGGEFSAGARDTGGSRAVFSLPARNGVNGGH